jgi:hypothetical protein
MTQPPGERAKDRQVLSVSARQFLGHWSVPDGKDEVAMIELAEAE